MIVGMVVLVLLELIVSVPPPRVIAPLTVNGEVLLFAFIVVTAPVPAVTGALISTTSVPVPELVTVPELLMARPEIVMPFVIVLLLLLRIRLPVPMIPPETVRSAVVPLAALLLKVVPPAPFTVMAVVDSVSGEVALLSVTAVTLLPTPPLIVVAAAPVPEFVMAPVTFSGLVEIVIPPVAALLLRVRFPAPATPPEIVSALVDTFVHVGWRRGPTERR